MNKSQKLKKVLANPELKKIAESIVEKKEYKSLGHLLVADLDEVLEKEVIEEENSKSDIENADDNFENNVNAELTTKEPLKGEVKEKVYYMKDKFFGRALYRSQKKGKETAKEKVIPVNYYKLQISRTPQTFVQGVPITEEQLILFSEYQKEYYLELR